MKYTKNGLVGGPSVRKMKSENAMRSTAWVPNWNQNPGRRSAPDERSQGERVPDVDGHEGVGGCRVLLGLGGVEPDRQE